MELLKKNFEALQIFREKPMEVSPIFKAREVYWTDRIWFASFPNCKLQQDLFQEVTMKNSFYIPRLKKEKLFNNFKIFLKLQLCQYSKIFGIYL